MSGYNIGGNNISVSGSNYSFTSGTLQLFQILSRLKGQCHEFFCFWFFFMNQFSPSPPEYPIRTVFNFFGNSRRYSQVKVHHRYQRHRWQICEFSKTALMVFSGAWGKQIHEKNPTSKNSCYCPFLMDLKIYTQSP